MSAVGTVETKLFSYLKSRYPGKQIELFNQLLRTRRKIRNIQLACEFYSDCIEAKVAPKFLQSRIRKSACKYSPTLERIFLTDEINSQKRLVTKIQSTYEKLLTSTKNILTNGELERLLNYISSVDEKQDKAKKEKHASSIELLKKCRYGDNFDVSRNNVSNLSNYKLDDDEMFVLAHGLNYSMPPNSRMLSQEQIFAEFEVLAAQLEHHVPVNLKRKQELKASLVNMAHAYCGTPLSEADMMMHSKYFKTVRRLKNEDSIRILKPNKEQNRTDTVYFV